jgi:hypothetical protein
MFKKGTSKNPFCGDKGKTSRKSGDSKGGDFESLIFRDLSVKIQGRERGLFFTL